MGTPVSGTAVAGAVPGGVPTSDVENALTAAKGRGDWDGYVRVLLTADVLAYVGRQEADRLGPRAEFPVYDGPSYGPSYGPGGGGAWGNGPWGGGGKCFVVHTRGELLPPRPDQVPVMVPVPVESKTSYGGRPPGLWVNPGTPSEAYFPGTDELYRHWERLRKEMGGHEYDGDALVTKYTGPLHGPLAHGLACGGHLPVHRRVFWNDIGDVYDDYLADVENLRDAWGVNDRQGWHQQLTHLMDGRGSPPRHEFVLTVRKEIAGRYPGAHNDPRLWGDACVAALRARGVVDENETAEVLSLIGRILRCEACFHADGLLPPDGYVTSVLGYDCGRAVNFARWGLGARHAAPQEVEQAVLRVGELCRERYVSWEAFSAGYVLGHVLSVDEQDFGQLYGSVLGPHRILAGDPAGPWRNIPFRLGD